MIKDRETFLAFWTPGYTEEEIDAVKHVMRSGWMGMGQETIKFENELASFVDAKNIITVNSCTSALFLSLLIKGVGKGDELLCQA